MHIISKKPFKEATRIYPKYAAVVLKSCSVLKKIECNTPEQLKTVFSSLDNFKYKRYAIEITGNNIRAMTFIEFRTGKVFVKHLYPYHLKMTDSAGV